MAHTPEILDCVFETIERAACAGARCPINGTTECPHGATTALATEGRILVEVFAHNWRRVTILTGPHRGKTTMSSPHKGTGRPYRVTDKNGSHVNGRTVDTGSSSRTQPSPPRPLIRGNW